MLQYIMILIVSVLIILIIITVYAFIRYRHYEEFVLYKVHCTPQTLTPGNPLIDIALSCINNKNYKFIYNNENFMIYKKKSLIKTTYLIISMGQAQKIYDINSIPFHMMIFVDQNLHFMHESIRRAFNLQRINYNFVEILNIIHKYVNINLDYSKWYDRIYHNLLQDNTYQEVLSDKIIISFYKNKNKTYVLLLKACVYNDLQKKIEVLSDQIEHLLLIANHNIIIQDPQFNWTNCTYSVQSMTTAENMPTSTGIMYYSPKALDAVYKMKSIIQNYFQVNNLLIDTLLNKNAHEAIIKTNKYYSQQIGLLFDFFIYINYYTFHNHHSDSVDLIDKIKYYVNTIDNTIGKKISFLYKNNSQIFKSASKKIDLFARIIAYAVALMVQSNYEVIITWNNNNQNQHFIYVSINNSVDNENFCTVINNKFSFDDDFTSNHRQNNGNSSLLAGYNYLFKLIELINPID